MIEINDENQIKIVSNIAPSKSISKKDAVVHLENSWQRISEDLVIEAWNAAILSKFKDEI